MLLNCHFAIKNSKHLWLLAQLQYKLPIAAVLSTPSWVKSHSKIFLQAGWVATGDWRRSLSACNWNPQHPLCVSDDNAGCGCPYALQSLWNSPSCLFIISTKKTFNNVNYSLLTFMQLFTKKPFLKLILNRITL